MALKLSPEIISSEDLRSVILELIGFAKWLRQNEIKMKVTNKPAPNKPSLSDAAAAILNQLDAKLSADQLDGLIKSLNDQFKSLPKASVTLAAMPGVSVKRQLAGWCRDNISPLLLIDFRYNAAILGGMVVNVGSRTFDWSFRRQLLEHKDKLAEAFLRVR